VREGPAPDHMEIGSNVPHVRRKDQGIMKPAITYAQLDGAISACARFEADCPNTDEEADQVNAIEAKGALHEMRHTVRHGGVVVCLTRAELNELRRAAGNSVGDPDWIKDSNRNALLSVADKIGFSVAVWGKGGRSRSRL